MLRFIYFSRKPRYPHNTDPDIFRESLSYSEGVTGFTANLIEKDYYCSLILHYIFDRETPLVFKGGTCLSKVYADFYRLSEDLDLVIPVSVDTSRNQRRSKMDPMKKVFDELPAIVPGISASQEFSGHSKGWIKSFTQGCQIFPGNTYFEDLICYILVTWEFYITKKGLQVIL